MSDKSKKWADAVSKTDIFGTAHKKTTEFAVALSQIKVPGLVTAVGDKSKELVEAVSRVNVTEILATADKKSKEFADTLAKTDNPKLADQVRADAAQGVKWVALKATDPKHARIFASAGLVGVTGIVMMVAPGVVASPILGSWGLSAQGVVGGTAAAAYQSYVGNAVAGGLLATLQSAAMGGYGVGTVYPVVQALGGAMTVAATTTSAFMARKNKL